MNTHRASFPVEIGGNLHNHQLQEPLSDFINLLSGYIHLSENLLTTDDT